MKGVKMNSIKKPLLVAGIVGTVGIGTLATGAVANAESGATESGGPMSGLVDKLVSTFNLDKDKVQEVFDEQRTEMEQQREQGRAEKLQALVDDGTITSAQKTAIETKIKEMKESREQNKDSFKDMTEEERKSAMDEKRIEMESWAEEQGIDLNELKGIFGGPGGHGGPRGDAPPQE